MLLDTEPTFQDQGCHHTALSATRKRKTIIIQSFNGKLHMWPNSTVFDKSYPTVKPEYFHQISQQSFFRSHSCTSSNEARQSGTCSICERNAMAILPLFPCQKTVRCRALLSALEVDNAMLIDTYAEFALLAQIPIQSALV